jgi:hypothetical protein
MSNSAMVAGLVIALLMFLFSSWMYIRSGDWVAAVFALGSVAYALFFFGRKQ